MSTCRKCGARGSCAYNHESDSLTCMECDGTWALSDITGSATAANRSDRMTQTELNMAGAAQVIAAAMSPTKRVTRPNFAPRFFSKR